MQKGFTLPAWRLSGRQILALVVALIAIYIVYGVLVPSVIPISSTRTVTLALNQTQFIKIYNGSTAALELRSASVSGASFYITSVPALYNPVVAFTLAPVTSLNVSTGGSTDSDMNIRLISSSNSSATVEITPLFVALHIRPSSSVVLLNPSSLSSIGSGGLSTISTISTTSTASTTTIVQNATQSLYQKALTLMNKTGPGMVLKGYSALYKRDVACTSSVYNSTYFSYYNKKPPAPVDFYNLTVHTPTGITINESALKAKDNVLITYSTVSPSPDTTGPAVLSIINTSSSNFLSSLTYTGLYAGLNYSTLNSSYAFQSKILNDCGAYITPP